MRHFAFLFSVQQHEILPLDIIVHLIDVNTESNAWIRVEPCVFLDGKESYFISSSAELTCTLLDAAIDSTLLLVFDEAKIAVQVIS